MVNQARKTIYLGMVSKINHTTFGGIFHEGGGGDGHSTGVSLIFKKNA